MDTAAGTRFYACGLELHGIQMKNLHSKRFALAIFVLFAATFIGIAFESGKNVTDLWSALAIAYKTIPILLIMIGFFVGYAWRWRIFRGWLVPFPNLNGTWQGTLQTTWMDPETGQVPGPLPVILTIRQSFTRVSCVMRSQESTSHSCLSDFWLDEDEQVRRLGYSYHAVPSPVVAHKSPPHEGTIIFELIGKPVCKLKGHYWTSRKTTGEAKLEFREKSRLEEFPTDLTERVNAADRIN
jgi:hypothetical protein